MGYSSGSHCHFPVNQNHGRTGRLGLSLLPDDPDHSGGGTLVPGCEQPRTRYIGYVDEPSEDHTWEPMTRDGGDPGARSIGISPTATLPGSS